MDLFDSYKQKGIFSPKILQIIEDFKVNYLNSIKPEQAVQGKEVLKQWLKLVIRQLESPARFEIFHQAIRHPFDYYQFGLDLIRPLINFGDSRVLGLDNLQAINEHVKNGQNVILLANHQTEPDPQIISLLIEQPYRELAQKMIFIAGHRVINDPLAVPMSLGRNLLCIYSKKHIEYPPEEKSQKILHNQRTLKKMQELLAQGGQCIYVAPSGGRDRLNAQGLVEIAPFDPDSLELFRLIAKQSGQSTHFYPLALKTYPLMPPPKKVEKELGEERQVAYTPVYLAFGKEINMDIFPGSEQGDKQTKRIKRANYIYDLVKGDYQLFN